MCAYHCCFPECTWGGIEPFTEITLKTIYCFLVLAWMNINLQLSGVGLDAYFKRVAAGRSFGHLLGKGSISLWEVYARIVWMECTFFGMQVQALLKSSNQVSARVCEANSLYQFSGSFYDTYGHKVKCKRNVPTEQKNREVGSFVALQLFLIKS